MAVPVLILGESGTGKSASLRNGTPDRFGIINVSRKPLPFRSSFRTLDTDDYNRILGALSGAKTPSIVIDDSQYLMVNAFMRRSNERGYDKFSEIAYNHWNLIYYVQNAMPPEKIVYFMSHIARDFEDGREHAKTVGKMIDQYITLEGMFTIVLRAFAEDGRYGFYTHSRGMDTVKTPIGMFLSDEIDNDLMLVDDIIREYYGIQV